MGKINGGTCNAQNLKNKSCLNEFLNYILLNILGMLGQSCYILADTFFVSKALGANGLAALNIALPIFSFIIGSGLMLGMGGAIRFSIVKANDKDLADGYFTNSIIMGAVISLAFVGIGLAFPRQLSSLLGANDEVLDLTTRYMHTVMMFAPAFIGNNILQCFVRNDGNPRLSMLAMVIGSLSNVVLDYVFMFPLNMGMFGAALATGVSPVIGICISFVHIIKGNNGFRLIKPRFKSKGVAEVLTLGFPSLVNELSGGIVIIVFNYLIMNLAGSVGVAAYGVIANISMVVISIFTGIAQGTQPLLSRSYGVGDNKKADKFLKLAIGAVLIAAGMIYVMAAAGAEMITDIFNSEGNETLRKIAVLGMRIYFVGGFFAGLNIIFSAYFAAVNRAVPAHAISVMRGLVLIIPVAFIMAKMFKLTGVWLAFPVTEAVTSIIGIGIFISCKRLDKKR